MLDLIKRAEPPLYAQRCWGRSSQSNSSVKSLFIALNTYSVPIESRPSRAKPPFLKLSTGRNATRHTLKPEIWARHQEEQFAVKAAQRRERDRLREAREAERKALAAAMEGAQIKYTYLHHALGHDPGTRPITPNPPSSRPRHRAPVIAPPPTRAQCGDPGPSHHPVPMTKSLVIRRASHGIPHHRIF